MTDDEDNQRAAADRRSAAGPAHRLVTAGRRWDGDVSGENERLGAGSVHTTPARVSAIRHTSVDCTMFSFQALYRHRVMPDPRRPLSPNHTRRVVATRAQRRALEAHIGTLPCAVECVHWLRRQAASVEYLSASDGVPLPRYYVPHPAGRFLASSLPELTLFHCDRARPFWLGGRYHLICGRVMPGERFEGGAPC